MSLTEKTDIRDSDEKVVEIEMERLRNFTNHPFKVIGDSQMIELQDSIKKYGVLNPLIVRPRKEGYYEIISGHRRKYAAERLGYKKIPVIIRMMQDDEAVVTMVDSNLQREQITPSEKAYVMVKIWEQLLEQNRELFSDCGPFCMNGGCEEGKMTCGKSVPPQMLPTDIIRVDFPKLCEESVLEEGVSDEDTAD